ncbi:hypothetical protein Cus16_1524 [Curtobacterium sp. ER1/6]|nr:hypothetical protein Cus16_1524 [Curtobacterium sp. ER1/6]
MPEVRQCFADRRPGAPEPQGELLVVEQGARGEDTAHDLGTQSFPCLVPQAGTEDGVWRSEHRPLSLVVPLVVRPAVSSERTTLGYQ